MTTDSSDRVVVNAAERFRDDRPVYVHGSAAPAVVDRLEREEVVDGEVVDDRAVPEQGRQAVVARVVRTVTAVRIRRPRSGVLDQVDRNRLRARRRARAHRLAVGAVNAAAQTGRGGGVVLSITGRGILRWMWLPEDAALVARIENAGEQLRARRSLGKSRRARTGFAAAAAGATGLTAWLNGATLAAAAANVPAWYWYAAGAATAGAFYLAGRGDDAPAHPVDHQAVRDGLLLTMGERAVRATLGDAFAEQKIRAVVVKVHPFKWGWRIELEVTTVLTEPHLANLALLLDTRRGGLIFHTVASSERSRVMTVVKRDLLAVAQAAPPIVLGEHEDIHTPVLLAPRFDGEPWLMRLSGLHLVLIGKLGSGKSTGLHRIVDALVQGGAVVGGIDLSGGADLRSWEPVMEPRLSALGTHGGTVPDAATALSTAVGLIRDRKARLAPGTKWRSSRADPPIRIVIDEYGLVAANTVLLELVDEIALYGRHVDIHLVVANHELTVDMMGTGRLSKSAVKVFFAMDLTAAKQLPKELRVAGVAPGLLVPATPDNPYDAGKSYVTGLGEPFLVRFGPYENGEASRRARALEVGRGRPRWSAADELVVEAYLAQNAGVPPLLLDAYDAIRSYSSDRDPARATSEEIATYLRKEGHDVSNSTVTARIRAALGDAYPARRKDDMNLGGRNLKGWTLDDLEAAIDEYRRLNPAQR